jgi:phosphoadenosine phosphosulfate reductase
MGVAWAGKIRVAMADAPFDLDRANAELSKLSIVDRVRWAVDSFGTGVVLLASMQRTSLVLMHVFYGLGLANEILFVDTGYHFFETLRLRDQVMRQWRLNVVTLYPELTIEEQEARYGKKLFSVRDGQPECCRLRKEEPLLKYFADKSSPVLVNGLRREEGGRRANLRAIGRDPRTGGYQLSPLFDWQGGDVEAYTAQHGLPVHPLFGKGYASVGCYPCTTPIQPGEDERAGRWRHLRVLEGTDAPQYCGINFSDGNGI